MEKKSDFGLRFTVPQPVSLKQVGDIPLAIMFSEELSLEPNRYYEVRGEGGDLIVRVEEPDGTWREIHRQGR